MVLSFPTIYYIFCYFFISFMMTSLKLLHEDFLLNYLLFQKHNCVDTHSF